MRRLLTLLALLCCTIAAAPSRADVYTVTSTDDDGPGTLRQAILDANAHAGADTIQFAIDPGGAQTIQPLSPLPDITDALTIDGTTQTGYTDTPLIQIEGSLLPDTTSDGLRVLAPNCALNTLIVSRFGDAGVYVGPGGSAVITGCWLGTDFDGSSPAGSTYGIWIQGQSSLVQNSVISANGIGILLDGGASGNTVTANYIGTDFSGGAALGNDTGIRLDGAANNTLNVNIVCASQEEGVSLVGGASGNTLLNNWIGVTAYAQVMGGGLDGVEIGDSAGNSLISNVIAANALNGVILWGSATTDNLLQANTILANALGVAITGDSHDNTLGGPDGVFPNLISGNIVDGVTITGAASSGNVVSFNAIRGNGGSGVTVFSSSNRIWNNIITENLLNGVFVGQDDGGVFAVGVSILTNAIWNNGDEGIRLDAMFDMGGNNLQPAPTLSNATRSPSRTDVSGSLVAAPNTTYLLEFFDNADLTPSGYGDGETYLGHLAVTTDGGGNAFFAVTLPGVDENHYVTATATDPAGNTSEFSLALLVNDANPGPVLTAIDPDHAQRGGSALTVTLTGSGFVAASVARFNGQDRATTYVSPTQLQIQITASDLSAATVNSVTVFSPAPGGGESSPLGFTVNNPAPALLSLSPASVPVGSDSFTLTVTGSNFEPESVIRWNGADQVTTYVSSTQLTTTITGLQLSGAGTANVTVFTSGPGGGESDPLTFTITNPAPTLTALSQNSVTAGSASITLTLTGTNFVRSSVVRWNGADRDTVYISSTQLQINLSRADLAAPGIISVTTFTPGPGGGLSSALPFTINGIPLIALSTASAARNGSVTVTFTLQNVGTAIASGAYITIAKLDNKAATTPLPLLIGDIPAGASTRSLKITFPGTVGSGSKIFAITLTANRKSLSTSRTVAVP